ncbi:MAG: PQQ-dependent sugar dehydrogenase, partial [Chitinophagales bacterium]
MKMIIRPFSSKSTQLSWIIFLLIASCVLLVHCKKKDTVMVIPVSDVKVDLLQVADSFVSPLDVVPVPDNTQRLFVIDQIGKIWIIDSTGNKLSTPFLDVSSALIPLSAGYDERGLLGLAFHPQFATNHKFYIYYQLPPRAGGPAPGS